MNNNEKVTMPVWRDKQTPVDAANLSIMCGGINQNGSDIEALSQAMALLNESKFDKVTLVGNKLIFFANEVEKYSITLPTGEGGTGIPGQDGREIELRKGTTHIEWRYVGESNWTSLVALEELKGENGAPGITPNITIGEVTTLAPGSNATVTKTGTQEAPIFNFGIPQGQPGGGEGGPVDLSAYQQKNDSTLNTTDKTIVGAINEIASDTSQNKTDIEELKKNNGLNFRDPLPDEIFTIEGSTPPPTIYGNIVLSKSTTTIVEGGTDTFTVKLDKAPTNNQVVTLTKNNNDVTLNPTSLTFTPQNYNTTQTVTINVVEDDEDYSNESCTITLSSPNVSNKTIEVSITDNDQAPSNVPVQSITLNHSESTIQVNGTLQLTPIFNPTNATNQNVTWDSNNKGIATVSSSGLVTGIGDGSCTITCTTVDGNKTASCNVSVSSSEVPSVQDSVIFNEGYLQVPIELLELAEVTAYSRETYKVFSFNKIKLSDINSLIEKVDITNLVKENSLEGFELVNWGSFTEDSKLQYAIRSNNYIAIKIPKTSLGSMTVKEFLKSIGVENLSFKTKSDMIITRIDSSKFTTFSTRETTIPNAQYVKIGYQNDNVTNTLGLSNKGFKVGEDYVWTAKYECLKIKDNFLEILFKPNTLADLSLDGVKRYLISNNIIIYS
ncbi:Ig-like domain-containing protein [Clostridium perfringens]|nr:Ig-like domain-containing protein [Clostridium perfringens]